MAHAQLYQSVQGSKGAFEHTHSDGLQANAYPVVEPQANGQNKYRLRDFSLTSQGFTWVNEARQGQSAKWGFVARSPGDSLEVDVGLEGVQAIDGRLTIGLGFLVSLIACSGSARVDY